jgi:hypothetical protein
LSAASAHSLRLSCCGLRHHTRAHRYQIHQGGVVALAFIAATNPASFMLLKSGVFGSQLVSAPVSKRFEVGGVQRAALCALLFAAWQCCVLLLRACCLLVSNRCVVRVRSNRSRIWRC